MGLVHLAPAQVVITGAMRNTMFNGQLAGLIGMDSICTPGACGLGPLEYLRGELLVLDGHCYVSTGTSDSTMRVDERRDVSAPFFVHTWVGEWREVPLPDSIMDLTLLEAFLTGRYAEEGRPFAFTLSGQVYRAVIHVVDLPLGTVVHSPDDAHQGRKTYEQSAMEADVLGFFSTKHKAVFTHHDTNVHVHLISADRKWMGHADELSFDPRKMRLRVAVR